MMSASRPLDHYRLSGGKRISVKSMSIGGRLDEEPGLQTRTIEAGSSGNFILKAVKNLVEYLPPITALFL
jgi:hypothetical protein